MQSLSHSIPRCVLAQNYLDNIHRISTTDSRNNDNNQDATTHGGEDRNTDVDEKYQDMIYVNGRQRNDRREIMGLTPGIMSNNRHFGRLEDDLREAQLHRQQHYQHRHEPQPLHQQQQHLYCHDADRNLDLEYQNQQYQHQQSDRRQIHHRHSPLSSAGVDASAYKHHVDSDKRYRHYTHSEMSKLEAMFPPLHDPVCENNNGSLDNNPCKTPVGVEQMPQQKHLSLTGVGTRLSRQPHLLPPPILIPRDVPPQPQQKQQAPQEKRAASTQQQLPSPVHSASSPESPSSLAIHLYVHHHHHHHAQEPSPVSATSSCSSSSTLLHGTNATTSATSSSDPLALLSPLTFPLASPLESEPNVSATGNSMRLPPSPPSPTPEVALSHVPLVSSRPAVSLLPSLSIPASRVENNARLTTGVRGISTTTPTDSDSPASLPWFTLPDSLANSNNAATSSLSSVSSESLLSPSCLVAVAATTSLPLPPQLHPRRHRHSQGQRHRLQLTDPAFAAQLLSTISSEDLARLYVHAAHHLHSHQPIYRYVLMKMIMTQAELTQYGRLRAEMPRAPGPSTGPQPKRTGFGSYANTGTAARPKVPSKLGQFVVTADRYGDRGCERYCPKSLQLPLPPPLADVEGLALKSKRLSIPWTRSLPSLAASLTSTLSKRKSLGSEPDLYSVRRLEELELGERVVVSDATMHTEQSHVVRVKTSRSRRPGNRQQTPDSEDDGDVGIENQGLFDDEGSDEDEDQNEEEEGGEESTSYWSFLKRKNNRSHRRLTRSAELKEHTALLCQLQENNRVSRHFVCQHQHHSNQPAYPSFSSAVSTTTNHDCHNIITSSGKPKNARRRTVTPSHASMSSSRPQGSGRALIPTPEDSSPSSFTESYGFSGLLMFSLFVFFLFVIEARQFMGIIPIL
ncbi:hypothetical protein EDD21DRAFT_438080 [Dissophora ornata]|nr:hypothetical protein EDD21DRAFT_438080 [Dissophora ornata]